MSLTSRVLFSRGDFQKEVRLMAQLKDPNIVRVMGVCTRDEPQCVIVEYMKYGDLNQYLHAHIPAEGNTMKRKKGSKQLRYVIETFKGHISVVANCSTQTPPLL